MEFGVSAHARLRSHNKNLQKNKKSQKTFDIAADIGAMGNKGFHNIPGILPEWITFLARVLPVRSAPTFIELLGAMITKSGSVTDAWLAIDPKRSWSAYYKWLQKGEYSWMALGVQMARLVVTFFP